MLYLNKKNRYITIFVVTTLLIACILPASFATTQNSKSTSVRISTTGNINSNEHTEPTPTPTATATPTPTQTPSPTPTPTTDITNQTLTGLSGYPTSTTQIDNIIAAMQTNNLNMYRMSFNPTWMSGPHPYNPEYIQYFLDHTPSNWVIIVDRNHIYPPTEEGATTFRTNLDQARDSILQVCQAWPNNPRVWVEMGNEYVSTDFHDIFQGLIDDVRDAGYTNTLVIDKWTTTWSTAVFNDPCDAIYTGMHFYFNSWSVSGAINQMQIALNLGLKIVNTEVGADCDEYSQFDSSEVAELNDFLNWCTAQGIANTVWMNENLNNMPRYQELNLTFP